VYSSSQEKIQHINKIIGMPLDQMSNKQTIHVIITWHSENGYFILNANKYEAF
jgi:hypothetical protein